jgi:hypothetical protein
MFATYATVGLWRHGGIVGCDRRDVYNVVVCIDGVDSFCAVMDDFGNLVRVPS